MFSAPAVKLCTEETTSAINKSKNTFRHNHTISAVNCCITSSDIFSFPSNSSSVSLRGTVKVRISSAISKHASTRYDRHPKILSSLLEKSMLQFSRAARTLLSACQPGNLQKRARNGRPHIYISVHFVPSLQLSLYPPAVVWPINQTKREVAQPKGENRLTGTQYAQRALHLAASAVHLRRTGVIPRPLPPDVFYARSAAQAPSGSKSCELSQAPQHHANRDSHVPSPRATLLTCRARQLPSPLRFPLCLSQPETHTLPPRPRIKQYVQFVI
jgi:hypothetical protein